MFARCAAEGQNCWNWWDLLHKILYDWKNIFNPLLDAGNIGRLTGFQMMETLVIKGLESILNWPLIYTDINTEWFTFESLMKWLKVANSFL